MKLDLAIGETHRSESRLSEKLLEIGERHKSDHDVFHMTRTLSSWSQHHVELLAEAGEKHGTSLDADTEGKSGGPLAAVREKGAELMGRKPEPGLLLLRDLRELYLLASEVSINWVMLGQGAQAARDSELLELVSRCHPQTLRQVRWTNQRIKEASPQVLTS